MDSQGHDATAAATTPALRMQHSQSRISLSTSFEALAVYFPCMNSFDEDDGEAGGKKLQSTDQRSMETGLAEELDDLASKPGIHR